MGAEERSLLSTISGTTGIFLSILEYSRLTPEKKTIPVSSLSLYVWDFSCRDREMRIKVG